MLRRNPILAAVVVVVGGTWAARHFRALGNVPGFSPNG